MSDIAVYVHVHYSNYSSRAHVERENHDLTLERIKLKAAEKRTTRLESVK